MDILSLASIASVQGSIFVRPKGFEPVADIMKSKWARGGSDHKSLLNALRAYERAWVQMDKFGIDLDQWCFDNFLSRQVLNEVLQIRRDLATFLQTTKLKPSRASISDPVSIPKTLAIAFCTQVAILRNGREYRTVPGNSCGLLSPTSVLNDNEPQWIVFTKYQLTGIKPYFDTATSIDPKWLVVSWLSMFPSLISSFNSWPGSSLVQG